MISISREKLCDWIQQAANNTQQLHKCDKGILIGSQAAFALSNSQRRPMPSADWDVVISPSCLLPLLELETIQEFRIPIDQKKYFSQEQNETPKKSLFTYFQGLFQNDQQNSSQSISLSVQLTILERPSFKKSILDLEVPFNMNSSAAQLLLYEFDHQTSQEAVVSQIPLRVASLEVLLALKKSSLHPTTWLKHTQDYHMLIQLDPNATKFSPNLQSIIKQRRIESAQTHKLQFKEVSEFDCHDFLKNTTEVQQVLRKYNSNSSKISQSQLKNATSDNLEFVAELLRIHSQQNKLSSPLASLELLAISESPSIWWTDFLQDHYPEILKKFMESVPKLAPQSNTNLDSISSWIFPDLPFDVVIIILSHMDVSSSYQASKFGTVSRSWKQFFADDFVWKILFEQTWSKISPEPNLSWKLNYFIRKNISKHTTSLSEVNKLVRLTGQFQRTNVEDLVQYWKDLLRVSSPSAEALKLRLQNTVYKLHWMIEHTYIHSVTHQEASDDGYDPANITMNFEIGCKELPKHSFQYKMIHQYGSRGSSRYVVEAQLISVIRDNTTFRKFDGPGLYGLRFGKWGLVGEYAESVDLGMENSQLFGLPEGIVTCFFIQLAEVNKPVKSYMLRDVTPQIYG